MFSAAPAGRAVAANRVPIRTARVEVLTAEVFVMIDLPFFCSCSLGWNRTLPGHMAREGGEHEFDRGRIGSLPGQSIAHHQAPPQAFQHGAEPERHRLRFVLIAAL